MGNSHSSTRGRSAGSAGRGGSSNGAAVTSAGSSRRSASGTAPTTSSNSLRGITPAGTTRRDGMGIGLGGHFRRSQQLTGSGSQAHIRSMDMSAQRARPQTAMARMAPQGLSASSLKDAAPLPLPQNSPYMHSSSLMNDSRISLLSMIAPLEEQTRDRDEPSFKGSAESTRLSLGSAVKGTKSSRTLSGEHSTSPETGRPRSRTQSSEGIVTVFSVAQKPPSLDPDLEALNKLPKYRPLVLAPSNNRLTGLFHSGVRYIEPTAEQLHLDETELTGFCFSFRDYVSNRMQRVCDRQTDFVTAARHMGIRAVASQARLGHVTQLAKNDMGGASVLATLQRQAEKSYELVQDIMRNLERLDAMLPNSDRFFAADSLAPKEFPCIAKMMAQRRRHSLPASASPHSSVVLRRQIAANKAGIPAFSARTTSMAGLHGRMSSAAPSAEPCKPRPGPYQLPGLIRHCGAQAPGRPYIKGGSADSRALRSRGSRGSMTGSESTNASAPVSPVAAVEPRLSFDGETISPSETASISALAVHGSGLRSVHKRATQPFGALRRPNSVASAYLDSGKGTHSRSEVSLSREQVVWSPQIGYGASESTFGFSSLDTMSMSPPLVMAGVGNFSEDSGVDRRCDIEGAFISRDEHTNFISAALATTDGDLVNNLSQINSAASDSAAHSESDCHFNNDFLEGKSPGSSLGRAASRVSSEYVRHSPHNISSPASAKSLRVPPLHRGGSMMSAASPRSLPRGLSLRSASSLTSSPSASSMASPTTPLGSPSIHIATNPLSVITMPEMSPVMGRQSAVSPQFPSEATRMLKRAIMEKPRKDSAETSPLASRTTSHTPTSDRAHHALVSIGAEADSENDVAAAVSDMKAAFSHGSRSRALSIAHSLKCALEEGEPVIQLQSGCLPKPDSEALPPSSDLVRGFCPSSRTNPERMSTWSSSSARTLADGMCGMRVPSMDDSRAGAKHTLPSAALYSLSASAAIVNQPLTHGDAASRGLNSSAASSVAARSVRGRPAADLGLSIRSDLERRVRSFSASEGGHSLPGGTRPHSSMGFHKPAAGARSSMWSTQSGSFRARRLSPHSNSMRFFRSENSAPHPHRLSVMSTGSNSRSARLASVPLDLEEHPSDAASIGSFSSQTTEMQLPSPPTSESQSQVVSPADAPAGKRRAQTMDQPLNVH